MPRVRKLQLTVVGGRRGPIWIGVTSKGLEERVCAMREQLDGMRNVTVYGNKLAPPDLLFDAIDELLRKGMGVFQSHLFKRDALRYLRRKGLLELSPRSVPKRKSGERSQSTEE